MLDHPSWKRRQRYQSYFETGIQSFRSERFPEFGFRNGRRSTGVPCRIDNLPVLRSLVWYTQPTIAGILQHPALPYCNKEGLHQYTAHHDSVHPIDWRESPSMGTSDCEDEVCDFVFRVLKRAKDSC